MAELICNIIAINLPILSPTHCCHTTLGNKSSASENFHFYQPKVTHTVA